MKNSTAISRKKIIALLFFVAMHLNVCAQRPSTCLAQDFKGYFLTIQRVSQKMLDELPSTFEEYEELWGYGGPLENQPSVVSYLYKNSLVNQTELISKLIDITVGAEWQADHVNYLQHTLQNAVTEDWETVVSILNKKTLNDNQAFWRFLFSSPHPSNFQDLKDSILKKKEVKIYKFPTLITQEYDYNLHHPVQ